MVRSRAVDKFLSPILTLFQGIPALSWVVFAIIWVSRRRVRILLHHGDDDAAGFYVSGARALRGMSRDLMEMCSVSARPGQNCSA